MSVSDVIALTALVAVVLGTLVFWWKGDEWEHNWALWVTAPWRRASHATVSERDEAQADWNHRLAEWQAVRAVRCQECRQIELPGEPWHVCSNPNPPIRATVGRRRGG